MPAENLPPVGQPREQPRAGRAYFPPGWFQLVACNRDQPLFLPRGSVRALLAGGIVAAVVVAELAGVDAPGLVQLAALAVGFYFAQRAQTPVVLNTSAGPEL